MLTYLNDPQLKGAFLAEIAKHESADQLVKGSYGNTKGTFKGCAIGCSLHSLNTVQGKKNRREQTGNHARYETELGIPIWLAFMEDHIFETLTDEKSKTWPREFAEAIPVGVSIPDRLLGKILHWTLVADTYGVRYATDRDDVRAWIDTIAVFIDADSKGEATADQREAAARAARAAWEAREARAAREAWAARAARAAWEAREARAARAARAAWEAREARAAWEAREAREAWAARAAWAAAPNIAAKAALFSTALARYVLDELRSLRPVGEEAGHGA